jgi:hypothetical protein
MRGFAARLRLGWLAVGLALLLVSAAQAKPAADQNVGARVSALGTGIGLAQSAQVNSQALTSGKVIRVTVRKGFIATNAANKKLYACAWGHCTKAGKALRKAAQHYLGVLQRMPPQTKTVARGLLAALTSLQYWYATGSDAVSADAAAKAKNQNQFNHWYALYKMHYKLGLKYQNRAVKILS